ncbi:unnamed protein product [Microthlaspi erraticum]|uniref:F-box associated beta-propeller type 1 domain-containing protein n=1 Tax=Microthlaspi erraticum TaxID=1685480 RepID=A0A6D2HPY4_9BRAS|nr:unnamed protein product [Microthlaspi erraticum]
MGEKLAVLVENWTDGSTEIWISNKIDPNAVSWTKMFLRFRMREIRDTAATFFVDEKKKVAVVFAKGKQHLYKPTRNTAYIFGEDGFSKQLDLGESEHEFQFPYVCSYVPSPVQIKQSAPTRQKEKKPGYC